MAASHRRAPSVCRVAGLQVINAAPGDLRMFYHSFDASKQRYTVGLATSPDGFRWTKQVGPQAVGCVCDGGGEGGYVGACAAPSPKALPGRRRPRLVPVRPALPGCPCA
jgi:hypothetical protein